MTDKNAETLQEAPVKDTPPLLQSVVEILSKELAGDETVQDQRHLQAQLANLTAVEALQVSEWIQEAVVRFVAKIIVATT